MLHIIYGNIVNEEILDGKDAFVLPTNPMMVYGTGVSGVVYEKAGIDELESYCEKTFNCGYRDEQLKNNMKPTEIRITPGFNLGMDIIFAQSPNTIYFDIKEENLLPLLIKTYDNVLLTIKEHNYKNVILPSLGTGYYGFSHEVVAAILMPKLEKFTKDNKDINIYLCLIDEKTANIYKTTMK